VAVRKIPGADPTLGTQMKIGRGSAVGHFARHLPRGVCGRAASLETGKAFGAEAYDRPAHRAPEADRRATLNRLPTTSAFALRRARIQRRRNSGDDSIDPWFLNQCAGGRVGRLAAQGQRSTRYRGRIRQPSVTVSPTSTGAERTTTELNVRESAKPRACVRGVQPGSDTCARRI